MNDTIVFDIETKNFFTDPGVGRDNFAALEISVVGIYSYERDEYACFAENEMNQLAAFFRNASRIVGFASNRFDIPVLNLYFQKLSDNTGLNLWSKERVDLLEKIETATGRRISLNLLARANLGTEKSGHGSNAGDMYARGDIERLKAYCLRDVEITRKLYDVYQEKEALLVPHRDGDVEHVSLAEREIGTGSLL